MLFVLITEKSCLLYFTDQLEHARIHPKFLHSNATSHKWAFGGKFVCPKKKKRKELQVLELENYIPFPCIYQIRIHSLFFFLILIFIVIFPAIAELLDNAVDEVKNIILRIFVFIVHRPEEIVLCGFS